MSIDEDEHRLERPARLGEERQRLGNGALGTQSGNPSNDGRRFPSWRTCLRLLQAASGGFLAETVINGGASTCSMSPTLTLLPRSLPMSAPPATSIVATSGEVPRDWRELQDDLTTAHFSSPPG